MAATLLDRIYAEMLHSGRPWPAAELGRTFLKLHSSGPAPERLVRSLLASDSRFREAPAGSWTARAVSRPTLDQSKYVLAWVELGDAPLPSGWRLHLHPHGSARDCWSEIASSDALVALPAEPEPWEALRRLGCRIATMQPGPCLRLLQWAERRWVLPEWDPVPLDLLSLARVALVRQGVPPSESLAQARLPRLAERWGLGPVVEDPSGAAPAALGAILDRLLQDFGSWTEEDLAEAWKGAFTTRPIPWERFAFTASDVDAVPETSGIYRFFDRGGSLLYIGKAARLSRRLASYFRALPPEPSKREQLLQSLYRFELTPLPSELEALVEEARAIRRERPPWNVQIEIHRPDSFPPGWWWPLVFVAGGGEMLRVSGFLVESEERSYVFHLPRGSEAANLDSLASWLEHRLERAGEADRSDSPEPAGPGRVRSGGAPLRRTSESVAPPMLRVSEPAPPPVPGASEPAAPPIPVVSESTTSPVPRISDPAAPEGDGASPGEALPPGVTALEAPETWLLLRSWLRQRDRLHRVDSIHFTSGFALLEALLALARRSDAAQAAVDQRPARLSGPGAAW